MAPWGGVTCCLSAAALYLLGRSSGRDAEALKSVTRVNHLKDLAQLLDTASKVLPFVVTISGRVGSDTPISCQYSGLRGVILEETAEQHFLKHNDAGSWIQDSALMLSMCKEVPWYLDDGTGRAFVVGGRGATGLVLTVGSEVFEEAGRSIGRGMLDYLQGLKMLGVKRVERVLPVGTPLTVIGEAVKDDIGTVRIQRPHKGPFYISRKTIDQLIMNLGKWARWYKYASMGFTVVGVYLLVKHAFQYITERRRHWELRKRVLAAAAKKSGQEDEGSSFAFSIFYFFVVHVDGFHVQILHLPHSFVFIGSSVKEENGADSKKDRLMPDLCVICLEQEYNTVFVQCGHMCCCMACSSHLTNCPLCRRRIEQVVRTFRH
ncbi:PREDICTED: E3 ubiquitin-protein ligase SP1 isoform X1 [Ipomoea nil]|uniref:E3 ubiquitin-protein ligase SP1 isoform X1 n=1 Tax=Ipomoea nil TaxID=35883 RepID=UPI0009010AC6|nr:PREDICTED: E3 ubiquitin-protein ligase SP1 isoform X1 [Ipomoea nil]